MAHKCDNYRLVLSLYYPLIKKVMTAIKYRLNRLLKAESVP